MTDAHIFVVIPVHDRISLTRACLTALDQQTLRDFTVVVVDDGSEDGTNEALRREFRQAEVLQGDGSLWWTGAMNVGVGWVLSRAAADDVVVTLNNDTIPHPGFLEGLARAHEEAPHALIGSLLVSTGDRQTIIDGGVHINWATAKYRSSRRGDLHVDCASLVPRLRQVDALSGCGTLVPLLAYRRAGPYDEKLLRQYAADFEFSIRAQRCGFRLLVDWAVPLYLDETQTGVHASTNERGLAGLARSFWDVRSANDLRTRLKFALAACPRWALASYVPMDYSRVIVSTLRRHRFGTNAEAG